MAYPDCFEPTRWSNFKKTLDEGRSRVLPASTVSPAKARHGDRQIGRRSVMLLVSQSVYRHMKTVPLLRINRSLVTGDCRLGPLLRASRAGSENFTHVFLVFPHYCSRCLLGGARARHSKECKTARGCHLHWKKSRSRS